MPNTPSRLKHGNVQNPSDSVLAFIAAAAMSVLSFKYASANTTYLSTVRLPNDWLSIASEVFLAAYFFLISRNAIANLLIILRINSPNFRSQLVSAITIVKTEQVSVDVLLDKLSPYLRHMEKDFMLDAAGEIKQIEILPMEATSFFSSMKRFRLVFKVEGGKVVDYEKEGLS